MTGHFDFNKHLTTIAQDSGCELCGEHIDSADHYFCRCPAFISSRFKCLGNYVRMRHNEICSTGRFRLTYNTKQLYKMCGTMDPPEAYVHVSARSSSPTPYLIIISSPIVYHIHKSFQSKLKCGTFTLIAITSFLINDVCMNLTAFKLTAN